MGNDKSNNGAMLGMLAGPVGGLVGQGLGMALGNTQRKNEMKDQKALMQLQQGNQMALNRQQQELAMKMWEDTNYDAQVKQMEKAGLNVGMMYGGSGAGGATTGGAQGGSAVGGQAPRGTMTAGAGMGMQLGMQLAQMELMKAQADKLRTETTKIGGVDTEKASQEVQNLINSNEGVKLDNALKEGNMETAIETYKIIKNNYVKSGNKTDKEIQMLDSNILRNGVDNVLKEAQTRLTNQKEKESMELVKQKWAEIEVKLEGLRLEEQRQMIQEFSEETKRNYPGVFNSVGGIIERGLNSIYSLFGKDKESESAGYTKANVVKKE